MKGGYILFFVAIVSMGMAYPAMGQEQTNWNVSAMSVLGDSSVDSGANTLFYPIFHLNLYLLPCNGSYSIILFLPNLLAKKMGLPYAEPFYTQDGTTEGLLSAVNYGAAAAHSKILSPNCLGHQSLNHQLRQVFDTVQQLEQTTTSICFYRSFSHLTINNESCLQFIESSLFYRSFGTDNYIDLFLHNFVCVMARYNDNQFDEILVNQMVHAMMNLYEMNVRKMVLMGVLPMGCAPSSFFQWQIDGEYATGCVDKINEVNLKYAVLLEESILWLNGELPDAKIVFCELYQGVKKILTYPHFFGFEDSKNACCGLGFYGAEIGCITSDMACDINANVGSLITDLPPALILENFNYLDPKEVGIMSCMSTTLRNIISEHHIWKEFYCERWGLLIFSDTGVSNEKSWTHDHTVPIFTECSLSCVKLFFSAGRAYRSSLKFIQVLRHNDLVNGLVPHDMTVAYASDENVFVWETNTGTFLHVICNAHFRNFQALARSLNGEFMFQMITEFGELRVVHVTIWCPYFCAAYSRNSSFPGLF